MYPPRLIEHFQNPRKLGELGPPAITVEVANPACGDTLRLAVRFAEGRAAEVRYKVRGCTASIAAGSALTEWMAGKTRGELAAFAPAGVDAGGFQDGAWMAALGVQFAGLYFGALRSALAGGTAPRCWTVLLERRNWTALARIQCALAGVNAHINHDLPTAIVRTGAAPVHGDAHYQDYTALNATRSEEHTSELPVT